MQVKTKYMTTVGGKEYPPNSIVEIEDIEAKALLRGKYVERLSSHEVTGDDTGTLTAEEIDEIRSELCDISGVNNELALAMIDRDFLSVQKVAELGDDLDRLIAISGIGNATAIKIVESANAILSAEANG